MKLLVTTIALAATLASPAFAQIVNGAPAPHGQYIVDPILPNPKNGQKAKRKYLPGDAVNANAASRALIRQDNLKYRYTGR
jgi:hypothetical protein